MSGIMMEESPFTPALRKGASIAAKVMAQNKHKFEKYSNDFKTMMKELTRTVDAYCKTGQDIRDLTYEVAKNPSAYDYYKEKLAREASVNARMEQVVQDYKHNELGK